MEYILSGVIAVAAAFGVTKFQCRGCLKQFSETNERIERVEQRLDESDKELSQKVMQTLLPVAKAVNKLNNAVGL